MLYKSEAVDTAISALEMRMRKEGKHLIKTESILVIVGQLIDLSDEIQERQELIEVGIKQVIQSRLYARGYFSVSVGYFVNVAECENLPYLQMIVDRKDSTIEAKKKARDRIDDLKKKAGEILFGADDSNNLIIHEYKPIDELMDDLNADAV